MTLPEEFCKRMKEMLGVEYDAFIRSYDAKINKGIRINSRKCGDTDALAAELGVDGRVDWCKNGYYTDKETINGSHPYHAAGMVYFQEPSAMCAAQALPLCEAPRILDLCAAPGGKTTQTAERMGNRGLLISNEIIPKRAAVLSGNVERMGLINTVVTNESPRSLSVRFPVFFDGIIVDAPCSGEGMFRKEPRAAQEWSSAHSVSCAERQKNILDDAYLMTKPGGYIVYSTCTFSLDENEKVIQYMAEKYSMEICGIPALSMLSPGIGDFPGAEKLRRVFPHKHGGEGHFAALLKKPETAEAALAPRKKRKNAVPQNTPLQAAVEAWREFESENLNTSCDGDFVLFGDELYLMPEAIDIDKLKVLRCGLQLGTLKKGRFVPAHALSHAFAADAYKNLVSLQADDDTLKRYMRGEVIPAGADCAGGWCVVAVNGCGIGWGKASGGIMKNHYPKGLRIMSA